MSGKGSNRRPMTVQYDLFESNWDRIFRRKEIEDRWTPEVKDNINIDWNKAAEHSANPPSVEELDMLREVNYDGMWQHSCTVDMRVVWIGKDETCTWCGAWEEDGDDVPLSLQ